MTITSDEIIQKIKLRSKIPDRQISDSTMLSVINDVIMTKITPMITSMGGNYLRFKEEITLTQSAYRYRFPTGAVGGGLLDVLRKDSATSENYSELPQIHDGDKAKVSGTHGNYFLLTAGGLEIFPKPSGNMYLEIAYLLRPGKLIKQNQAGLIANVTSSTIELTSTPVELTSGGTVDIMKTDGMAERVYLGVRLTLVSGSTFNTSVDISELTSVGDTVALAGHSPFLQVPDEYIDLVIDQVCLKLAQMTGDSEMLAMSEKSLAQSIPGVMNAINPRVKEEVSGVIIDF